MEKELMERVDGNKLEKNIMYYIELDNDSLRQYGAYKGKHYGKFIEYTYNNRYAYFENITNIPTTHLSYTISMERDHKFIGGVYWKFYKMKKYDIEKKITNSLIQEITGDIHFNYL